MKTKIAIALACLLLAAPSAHALHKCTGADGKVTYTDEPCEAGAKPSGVQIHDTAGMEAPKRGLKSGSSTSSTSKASATSSGSQKNNSQASAKCRQAQNNNRVLNTQAPVYTFDSKGNKVYLEDKERAVASDRANKEIAANCN